MAANFFRYRWVLWAIVIAFVTSFLAENIAGELFVSEESKELAEEIVEGLKEGESKRDDQHLLFTPLTSFANQIAVVVITPWAAVKEQTEQARAQGTPLYLLYHSLVVYHKA